MKRWHKIILIAAVSLFALVGLAFTLVFVGMQFGAFNVRGSIDARNAFFFGTSSPSGVTATIPAQPCIDASRQVCDWSETPEWTVVAGGLTKDAGIIGRVSRETGVSGRMIASVVIPEQIRFFTAEREVFKRYFEPLKILGSLSQFSLGVSGIKQETAARIEANALDERSPFYPGPGAADLFAYPEGADHDAVLYSRLTDDKDHYYSYLYTALYIQEIEAQWKRAGFDIADNPEAVVTLFNIGFDASRPNANPQVAGARIDAGGTSYPFGVLGAAFYRSDELTDIFPR